MTRSADEALDNLVVQLAVDDVVALSDDEIEQEPPSKVDDDMEANEDSEGFDYGDEEELDYTYDDMSHSTHAAESSGEVDDDDPLASFRQSWQAEVDIAHQPPLASPSLLKLFEAPSLLRRILSDPLLGPSGVRSAALVASPFLTSARSLLFHRINLDTPLRALQLLEALEASPHLAQHIDALSIGLGDLDAVLREVPFVQARMKTQREEQDIQPNEWFWKRGGEMDRQGPGREGKQAWEEDLRLRLGKRASTEEMEGSRRQELFHMATKSGSLSEEEQEELRIHLRRTFSSWPFDGLVDTVPSHQNDSDPYASTYATPAAHTLAVPTLSPAFARNLIRLLVAVPNLTFVGPAVYSASSALLPAFSLASSTKTLVVNPPQDDKPVAHRLGVALEQRSCRLSLRADGLGLASAPYSITLLDLCDCTLVATAMEDSQASTEEASSWGLRELKLIRVKLELQCEKREASLYSLVSVSGSPSQQGRQGTPAPSADLLRFVGASVNTLTSLSLHQVDGFSWSTINATISAHSSALVTLKLHLVNTGSSVMAQVDPALLSPPVIPSHPVTSSPPIETAVESEAQEEDGPFTDEQIRDFSPFGPHYDARHPVLSIEEISRRTKSPVGQRAHERSDELRLLSFKLWERWIGPNAIPVERVRKEQKQQSLAFHRSLASVDSTGPATSSTFDPSVFDRSPADEPSLLYALSRCTSLRCLHLTSDGSGDGDTFGPELVEALLYARPPLEELEWSVKMVHRSRQEWRMWEEKVREVMPTMNPGTSERVQVYVLVNLQRAGVQPAYAMVPARKAVRATRAL